MLQSERKKALFIINPKSGKMTIKNHIFKIANAFSDAGYEPVLLMTTKRGDATDFAEYYSDKVDLIVACGGDGTLNETVCGIMKKEKEKRCNLGFIPVGTTNDFAETLSLPKLPIDCAKVILEKNAKELDVGLFNGSRIFNYVASCGAFTAASYSTPQNVKNSLGHLAYILSGVKSINEIKPIKMKIKSDDFSSDGNFIFAGVTNSLSIGGVYKFDPNNVNLSDGLFEVMLVRSPNSPSDMFDLLVRLSNKDFDDKNVIFIKTKKIEFEFETETDWTVDGEFAGSTKTVVLENIHNAIKIFRP